MKSSIKAVLIAALSVFLIFAFAGCSPDTSEVAGRYELFSVTGTYNGEPLGFDYYRVTIDENGKGTIERKATGFDGYSVDVKCNYNGEAIIMTIKTGCGTTMEMYGYSDGILTYSVSNENANYTVMLTRQ